MASDSRLPIIIFLALVALIATPFIVSNLHESRRPVLLEARVVTATSMDPVFRDGRRQVAAGDAAVAALALRLEYNGGETQWLAPVVELVLDGELVEHLETADWPEDDRVVRVFWFTVESTNLGGELTADTVYRLRYRSFLAPEMGRGLLAERLPDAHNNDHLGQGEATAPAVTGTLRLYARVEVVEEAKDLRPLQSAQALDADRIFDQTFPTILRAADLGEGVHDVVGELFLLPGFEPTGSSPKEWDRITLPVIGAGFTDLVDERLVVSSWTLAAVAVSGRADLDPSALTSLGAVKVSAGGLLRSGRPLRWQEDVRPGDLLTDGRHWIILLRDQGDGLLDPADTVLHSWGRPPVITTLMTAMREGVSEVELLRHAS